MKIELCCIWITHPLKVKAYYSLYIEMSLHKNKYCPTPQKLSPKNQSPPPPPTVGGPCISLPRGTNDKPLAAIGKFPNAIGKLMIGKTLVTNGEEITNAMIGNAVVAIYW